MTSNTEVKQSKSISEIAEIVAIVASFLGSVGTLFTQQAILASLPLSVTVALNLVNRNNLKKQIEQNQTEIVTQFNQTIQENQGQFSTSLQKLSEDYQTSNQNLSKELATKNQDLLDYLQKVDIKQQEIEEIVKTLRDIENLSQAIRSTPESAYFYYQRGLSFQRLGDKSGAIGDYDKAINIDPNYARAYHNRGILHNELGQKRKAVQDLRKAAKFYFDIGDIESYQQAKDLSKNIYSLSTEVNEKTETLVVDGLFS